MTKMPWGKYKGVHIDGLPDHYLDWILSQPWMHEPSKRNLRTALLNEVDRRRNGKKAKAPRDESSELFTADEVKAMIRACHPDRNKGREIYNVILQKLNAMR